MDTGLINEIARAHHFMGIEGERTARPGSPGIRSPEWVHEGPVYAVYVRAFSEEGTLSGVLKRIPELHRLGIKTIWLLPIYPIGEKDRKGTHGSPYAIKDHKKISGAIGNPGDLKKLVEELHRRDMHIILDFVGNHAARDHIHQDLLLSENLRSPADWSDIADFDFALRTTQDYLMEVMLHWVAQFDIDGYRCDVAGMVPDAFWQSAIDRLFRAKPDLFLLAEWQRPSLHESLFHAGYDWVLYLILKDIRNNRRSPGDIIKWETERNIIYPEHALPLRFTENHDLPRTTAIFGFYDYPVFAGILFCLNGLPLMYAGQEWGIPDLPDLFRKDAIRWEQGDEEVYKYYRRLIKIRREHPALYRGRIKELFCGIKDVLMFRKYDRDENLIVLANFSNDKKIVELPVEYADAGNDLLGDENLASAKIGLDPFQLRILI